MKLRDYQKKDYKILKKSKHQHQLFGAATGYGKSAIIHKLVKKGGRTLVIAPRRKLVRQLRDTLDEFLPSIIMGTDSIYTEDAELYIASTATLHNRLKKYGKAYLGKIDQVIIDEAHINFGSTSMQQVIDLYWDSAKWVGLSATPIDASGYRLEGWDHTHYEWQTRKLINAGWLTEVKVMAEDTPAGLDDIKVTGGDYNEGALDALMSETSRVSNVYKIW